jgi:hypothetical protein
MVSLRHMPGGLYRFCYERLGGAPTYLRQANIWRILSTAVTGLALLYVVVCFAGIGRGIVGTPGEGAAKCGDVFGIWSRENIGIVDMAVNDDGNWYSHRRDVRANYGVLFWSKFFRVGKKYRLIASRENACTGEGTLIETNTQNLILSDRDVDVLPRDDGGRLAIIFKRDAKSELSRVRPVGNNFKGRWSAGNATNEIGPLISSKIVFGDLVRRNHSVGALYRLAGLDQTKDAEEDNETQRNYFNDKTLILPAIIFTAGGFVFLYKVWWKLSFDLTAHINVATYSALVIFAMCIVGIGIWLALDAVWGFTHFGGSL